MPYDTPIFRLMGDRSLLVELGDEISPSVNQSVQGLFAALDMHKIDGVKDLVPSYRSLLVIYDPLLISAPDLERKIDGFRRGGRGGSPHHGLGQLPAVLRQGLAQGGDDARLDLGDPDQ